MAVGSLIWGGLAGRTGRRKSLISCMAVSSVFSVIAAFMPTYGPFMMARFCAACGVVGAISAGSCYIAEISPPFVRARFLGVFAVFGVAGALLAGYLAVLVLPSTGQEIMIENKEHFSAWHRYLLLGSLPTIFSLFGLFWLSESPRWLLENGREVEALGVYQNIYKTNRARGGYTLTELELPGPRFRHITPPSVLADMAKSCSLFFGSFSQLFKKSYIKTTVLLVTAWAATIFVYTGLAIYTSKHSKETSAGYYFRNTIITSNRTYRNSYFNTSMDNQIYSNCTFLNTTFRDLYMTHITFLNSTFTNTEFSNVKTSGTVFEYSTLDSVSLIDTDLTDRHFTECIRSNISVIRMSTDCDRDFEYNIYFDALWTSQFGCLVPAFIMIGLSGEAIYRCGKTRIATVCFAFSIVLSITLSFLYHDVPVIWTSGASGGLMLCGMTALTIYAIDFYKTSLRCSAIGFFVCVGHVAALIAKPLYAFLPTETSVAASIISSIIIIVPFIASIILREPTTTLL
uniref:CSON009553 protein n=1 Tax=Culicoides sonorensis TaxID=179676 RepID=A0A336N197_CULSO